MTRQTLPVRRTEKRKKRALNIKGVFFNTPINIYRWQGKEEKSLKSQDLFAARKMRLAAFHILVYDLLTLNETMGKTHFYN